MSINIEDIYIDPLFNNISWLYDNNNNIDNNYIDSNNINIALEFLNNITLNNNEITSISNIKKYKYKYKNKSNRLSSSTNKKIKKTPNNHYNTILTPNLTLDLILKDSRKRKGISPLLLSKDTPFTKPYITSLSSSDESSDTDSLSSTDTKHILICPPYSSIPGSNRHEWENLLLHSGLLKSRIIYSKPKCAPICISSVIFSKEKIVKKEEAYPASLFLRDCLDSSLPSNSNTYFNYNNHLESIPNEYDDVYDPTWLDDPNINSGKHRTVINLPSYTGSCIGWVRESELKKELNEKFKLKHEWLHPSLTLSKIRKVKKLMVDILSELNLEASTISLGSMYFERLILKKLVDKTNRKLIGGTCLFIACKYNEVLQTKKQHDIILSIEKKFDISRKAIIRAEFPIFCELDFSLAAPSVHLFPQFSRVLAVIGTAPLEYLGEQFYEEYFGEHMDTGLGQANAIEEETIADDVTTLSENEHETESRGGDNFNFRVLESDSVIIY